MANKSYNLDMRHRHINTSEWTKDAIVSVLERGDLPDWRELFKAAKDDPEIAERIRAIACRYPEDGTFILAEHLANSRKLKNDK